MSEAAGHYEDEDVQFFAENLHLSESRLNAPLLFLDAQRIHNRITGVDRTNYYDQLKTWLHTQEADLILLEGPGTLEEGHLFNLSMATMAETLDAKVLLVSRFQSVSIIDQLLAAQRMLGDRLLGVVINDVPMARAEEMGAIKTFLEQADIPILGLLPRNAILRSVSVRELARQLEAEVLCRADRLDLMVENLTIGAMNVSAALKYFQNTPNMAVVTGGDRTDIQLAALETSTQCLVLTGHVPPVDAVLRRAEDLEVPILLVDRDTLTTVEIIDQAFGQVRFHEPVKMDCVYQLMSDHFDTDRLLQKLGLA